MAFVNFHTKLLNFLREHSKTFKIILPLINKKWNKKIARFSVDKLKMPGGNVFFYGGDNFCVNGKFYPSTF